MEVVVGTYDQSLCALRLIADNSEKTYKFEATFSDHGHAGCVTALACGDRFLASGSTDETIRLFDLKKRVELGSLNQQEGTITCLDFCGNSHLLSGSEDGTICVWECKTWDCLKTLKGHRDAVTSLSVHPTGRLALSVSKDKSLRTWNLITGRSAYVTNIKQVADIVCWSPSGDTYAVVTRTQVMVYKVSTAAKVYTIQLTKSVLAICFLTDDFIAIGGEMCDIEIHDVKQEKCMHRLNGHPVRVKGLKSIRSAVEPEEKAQIFLFSVSSDGLLISWLFQGIQCESPPVRLCDFELNSRPTCIDVSWKETRTRNFIQEKETVALEQIVQRKNGKTKQDKSSPTEIIGDSSSAS